MYILLILLHIAFAGVYLSVVRDQRMIYSRYYETYVSKFGRVPFLVVHAMVGLVAYKCSIDTPNEVFRLVLVTVGLFCFFRVAELLHYMKIGK